MNSRDRSRSTLRAEAEKSTMPQRNTPSPPRPDSRPRSGDTAITMIESKKRKKKGANMKGGHQVTFTVTVCQAVRTADAEVDSVEKDKDGKKKKRIMEQPKALGHYHLEYTLLPDDDDVVKTDLVTFGIAAKIYTEKHEPKVIKTWQNGPLTWIAWTQVHSVTMSDDLLLKLFDHTLELRVWDTRDKLSTRAKFDRPKAFKLPQPRPGEDPEAVGGVKALVLKQSEGYASLQPKRQYIRRPLPSATPRLGYAEDAKSVETGRTATRDSVRKQKKKAGLDPLHAYQVPEKVADYLEGVKPGIDIRPPTNLSRPQTGASGAPGQDSGPIRSYSRLGRLALDEAEEKEASEAPTNFESRAGGHPRSRGQSNAAASSRQAKQTANEAKSLKVLKDAMKAADEESLPGGKQGNDPAAKGRRNRKAEALVAAAADHARKFGICCIPVRMAPFFAAGITTMTNRLVEDVPGLEDFFLTVSVSGSLMSDEQCQKLNPLVIKVHSATDMPATPISYADLRLKCQPAYVKYTFYKQAPHTSIGRSQSDGIYWDDIHVVLTGTLDTSELREYLNGPAMEIEVHDRDRIVEKAKLTPTLFGDDLEDEKISNVGVVASKRTTHNPFQGRAQPWDPYGISKFDLSGFLQGQKVMYLKAPIHNCKQPDPLGTEDHIDGKLVGVAGALDGPTEAPFAAGHYLQNNSCLKIKMEITYPLSTPESIAENLPIETTENCPFGRIIFKFEYRNTTLLHKLQNAVKDINAEALALRHLPPHVVDAALSTYKLSLEQQTSHILDIVTGFQLMDGEMHLFILEGLRDGAISLLWDALPKQENQELHILYNSDLSFHDRLYGPLDVDLCRIKLHEPLSVIVQQPLLYVRDMVPKPCFESITKLDQLVSSSKLRDAVRNDCFPNAEMVVSMSREFGVPLTAQDFEELQPTQEDMESEHVKMIDIPRTSRPWTPIDNFNPSYMEQMAERKEQEKEGFAHNYIRENKGQVYGISEANRHERSMTAPQTIKALSAPAHNYSSQALNSTEQAKEALRMVLAQDPDNRYTYCPEYHHSMTVVPVNVPALKQAEKEASMQAYKTPTGWIYPGKKNMIESNKHPLKPHLARVDQLYQPWEENTLHANVLKPTLARDRYTWGKRGYDMDLWTSPHPVFNIDEPATIHLAGQKLREEQLNSKQREYDIWKSRVVVKDTDMTLHRCLPASEMKKNGREASNQLARLQGLLKDTPQKLALVNPGLAMREVPPLNVVLNPNVDTHARLEGRLPPPEPAQREVSKGFMPGPHSDKPWVLESNKIPSLDYQHAKFKDIKGQDFNVYHKERSFLHRQPIPPLNKKEYTGALFRMPRQATNIEVGAKPYYLPEDYDIAYAKVQKSGTIDSGIGTFINSQKGQNTKEAILC